MITNTLTEKDPNSFVTNLITNGFGAWFSTYAGMHWHINSTENFEAYMGYQLELIHHLLAEAEKSTDLDNSIVSAGGWAINDQE